MLGDVVKEFRGLFVTPCITGPESVKAACEEHPLCVIAFLPHILDCQVNHC
jgi:hypothetical protein